MTPEQLTDTLAETVELMHRISETIVVMADRLVALEERVTRIERSSSTIGCQPTLFN
jgi:methyl-accepting chemotaxis protein